MSHRHFCDVAGHWWECNGTALRRGETEPSVCLCRGCRLPLEDGDHARCKNRVELLACPEHQDEERRRMEEAGKEYERRAAEFGFDGKWARACFSGPSGSAFILAQEIVAWLFR